MDLRHLRHQEVIVNLVKTAVENGGQMGTIQEVHKEEVPEMNMLENIGMVAYLNTCFMFNIMP